MMMTKIVADSSADLLTLGDLPFASVPLTIHAGDRVFVDDEHCDIDGMIAFLRTYKGKTTTSCPNTECWLKAFGDADTVYCVTISSAMSGTYNAAMLAAKEYMELHPERRVHVFDSLSAVIKKDSYQIPPIFGMLAKKGDIEEHMMYNTYNMGIGMVVAVDAADAERAMEAMKSAGDTPYIIGSIEAGEKGVTLC